MAKDLRWGHLVQPRELVCIRKGTSVIRKVRGRWVKTKPVVLEKTVCGRAHGEAVSYSWGGQGMGVVTVKRQQYAVRPKDLFVAGRIPGRRR